MVVHSSNPQGQFNNARQHFPQLPIEPLLHGVTRRRPTTRKDEGGWRMEDGGWRMEDGGWRMEDGGRRKEGCYTYISK
jgi:hypothetical protein